MISHKLNITQHKKNSFLHKIILSTLFLQLLLGPTLVWSKSKKSKPTAKENQSSSSVTPLKNVDLKIESKWVSKKSFESDIQKFTEFISQNSGKNYSSQYSQVKSVIQNSVTSLFQSSQDLLKQANSKNATVYTPNKKYQSTMEDISNKKLVFTERKYSSKSELELKIENPKYLSPEEVKLTQGLIFFENNSQPETAMAVFLDLSQNAKSKPTKEYAQLFYGLALKKLGFYSEYKTELIELALGTNNSELKAFIIDELNQSAKYLEITDIKNIDKSYDSLNETQYPIKFTSAYLLKRAKYAASINDLNTYNDSIDLITDKDDEYTEAQLLKSILLYKTGKYNEALDILSSQMSKIEDSNDNAMKNLAIMTAARLNFQKQNYADAIKYYEKVSKKSELWLDSLLEQAWAQVLKKDYEGAAGNMFSLHTDYFKKIYAPESYIIRTIAYLNLCQYGDSLHVLMDFQKKYARLAAEINNLNLNSNAKKTTKATAKDLYEGIKNYLQNPKNPNTALSRPLLMELIKTPQFLRTQKQINRLEDEYTAYSELNLKIIKLEKEARLKMTKLKSDLASAKSNSKSTPASIQSLEVENYAQGIETDILSKAKDLLKKQRLIMQTRIDKEKQSLKDDLNVVLTSKLINIKDKLDKLIEQKEILSYEIYSGAGEQLRYQLAANDPAQAELLKNKNPDKKASAKSDSTHYTWKHQGEIWEDEIGYYRSSLENACAEQDKK